MQRIVLTFLCAVTTFILSAQTGTIRGFVYDKANGEAVAYSSVYLKGTTIGSSTDQNGFFSINKIPPGEYILIVTNLDYDTIAEKLSVKANDIINKKFYSTKGGINLDDINVTAEQTEKIENPGVGTTKIDPVVINKLPSVGEPDLAQYLQVLPGVVFTGDQGGQLYIRGGSAIQNKVLLDGMVIYNPFHSIGLFSVFDNDIMRNADVYSAGFGAEYGGRVSSIMDITTRDGNKKRIAGKVAASTFGAKLNIEGPLKKLREDGRGSSSFLVSGKTSYLPQTSKVLYPYANKDGLPFSYNDIYAKMSFNANNGSKINLFGFDFSDQVNYTGLANFKWNSFGGGSNFILIPNNSSLLIEGVFAYSQYKIDYKGPEALNLKGQMQANQKSSTIGGFNGGFNFIKFFGRNEFRYGFELIGTNTDYTIQNPNFVDAINYSKISTEIAGYMKYKWILANKHIVLEPSFRLHYYATFNNLSPEPRMSAKINVTRRFRLKGAAGMYSQSLMSASSDRDVVNLFYGFINGPDNLPDSYTNKDGKTLEVKSQLQKAWHAVGGFEVDVFKGLEIQVEAYEKFFNQLTNVNRDKLFDDTPENANKPDALKKDFVMEQGRARGLDFVAKYEMKRFYFWAVYSLTYNDRWTGNTADGQVFHYAPVWDRRHNVNLVATYTMGKKRNFEASVRWNYGSGFPFTPTQGYYPQINFGNSATFDYTTANAQLGYIGGDYNSQRLPSYHRLDANIKWRYKWTERTTLEVTAGATNMYNRENIFYFDRVKYKRVNQLPILPNVNISITF
ncbi:MAG: TonB-dependent receptor [Bacteroidetes bacterium]|nr:TonB-dependent receptor [Bacteroidota bacterium]